MLRFRFIIYLFNIYYVFSQDYCDLCKSHTMCRYKDVPNEACVKYPIVKMDIHIQALIVNLHNKLRNNVALGLETKGTKIENMAANMIAFSWDDELAKIAQRWADVCTSPESASLNDECRKTDRFDVGQNVYAIIGNDTISPNFVAMILDWYNEVDNINQFKTNTFTNSKAKNYSQMLWAETKYIGCGHSSSLEKIDGNKNVIYRFVCNYGPTGNVIGKPIYIPGKPCSKCADDYTCDYHYPGLCIAKQEIDTENRLREILYTVNDFMKSGSKDDFTYPKREYKLNENHKINEFSYSDIVLEYLARALDYHKRMEKLNEVSNGKDSDEVFVNMRELLNNKTFSNTIISEMNYNMDPSNQSSGYIVKESDYKKVDGIWSDGSCRCNYIFRSSTSSLQTNAILWFLIFLKSAL